MGNELMLDRILVVLGDTIGRGPESKSVIEELTRIKGKQPLVFLLGNHEAELIEFLDKGDFLRYALGGGLSVLRSYLPNPISGRVIDAFRNSFPSSHRELLREAKNHFENEYFFASHKRPLTNETHSKLVICGHHDIGTVPRIAGNLVCLDTGAGRGGSLSCYLWPEHFTISVPTC